MFFPLVYSFFSFFFQSLLDTCNFSSTLEKSGWREKVFISSVLEPFNFSPARSNNCPLNFSRFSVPRPRLFPLSRSSSLSFSTKVDARKEIARPVTSACWKLKFPFSDRFCHRFEYRRRKRFVGRNSSKRRRIFVNCFCFSIQIIVR